VFGWRWYQSQPKPLTIAYKVTPPAVTCYACDPPGKPNAMQVVFAGSVAPLEQVGKVLDASRAGLSTAPAVRGEWRWQDDRTLVLQPAEDWPIGQSYRVEMDRRKLFPPEVRLAEYQFEFSTAPFGAEIVDTEFYQDPQVATDKKAVIGIRFSHPVDPERLERNVSLTLFERVNDKIENRLGPRKFTVVYDKLKLNAFVHSQNLPIPSKQARIEMKLGRDVRAARGGNVLPADLAASVEVPGLDSLRVEKLSLDIARDERNEPRQVLLVECSASVLETAMPDKVHAWLLPAQHPDPKVQAEFERYNRGQPFAWTTQNFTSAARAAAVLVPLQPQAGDTDHYTVHGFRYEAEPGRYLYVEVDKGLTSFGGYVLGDSVGRLLKVPEFPRELSILHQGALLPMSGSKLLTVFSRNVPAVRVDVGRVLPRQVQTLVTQTSGSYSYPRFDGWAFNNLDVTERFTSVKRIPVADAATSHYEAVDLGSYLADNAENRRGIFLVRVQAWDADNDQPLAGYEPDWNNTRQDPLADARVVILTDLGLVAKRARDGSFDLFVQSITSGKPVAGVTIEVIGRNGLPVLDAVTDAQGHAHFVDFSGLRNERQPVLFLAHLEGDSVFLPVEARDRSLDFSRFDVGGIEASTDRAALAAYLFSDRGLYRPGEQIHVAALVRSEDWKQDLQNVPLRLEVVDPRGVVIRRETFAPGRAGFGEVTADTKPNSPTGTYTFSISTVRSGRAPSLIGSTTVQVRDFQPDRLRMSTVFTSSSPDGWVSPEQLAARVQLDNLFGTPAENRRITAKMTLTPAIPEFRSYPDYQFHDPQLAREGMEETLPETKTDAAGRAELALNLQRFARATYRVQLIAQGFEADGGRGVTSAATQLVSNMPYLVGYKPDGDLGYVSRGADRSVSLIAIDPQASRSAVDGLMLARVEVRYVSALMRQDNGTYKYESRRKEVVLDTRKLNIPASGVTLALDTGTPGTFVYYVRDAAGTQLARVEYQVAGDANVTRQLEKNSELEISLSRGDYAPGEDVEVSIRAPYAGAGLITIEREKVYAWQWFQASTTSSVQHIRLPEGLEGSAYVTVTFIRDPGSQEIYSSPLSYGVRPLTIATDARRTAVTVQVPATVKPGQALKLRYRTERPSRIVLYAVDEGILQVARYRAPDPLGYFFQKRALGVRTSQILDLILPEFRQLASPSAAGGDAEGLIGRNLNPFRRKGEKPVAFWSGILDADTTMREVTYTVPDYFNGTLRVFAVAADDQHIGVFDGKVTVRGDFVLTPVAPLVATPGDTFDVSTGIANNVEGSGANARVRVALAGDPALEVVGPAALETDIAEGREGTARFRVRVRDQLGNATLKFTTGLGAATATRTVSLSVRPATPYMTGLKAGVISKGVTEVTLDRKLYPQFRTRQAGASTLPLELAHGFASYLGHYPYDCTEQLVSQAMPATLLASRPEFGYVRAEPGADLDGLVDELRSRQNDEGAYRLWPGAETVEEFVSLYAQHWLLEAQERGQQVPPDLIRVGNGYLVRLAARDGNNLADERNAAYAIYLLTRQGRPMAAEIAALRKRLEDRYAKEWRQDLTAAWLAASLSLMKQDREASDLIRQVPFGVQPAFEQYYDPMTRDGLLLFLVARHFPARLATLPAEVMARITERVSGGVYQSLAAGATLLALDSYATAAAGKGAALQLSLVPRTGNATEAVKLPAGLLPRVDVPDTARAVSFSNPNDLPGYYLVEQSGFDRETPVEAIRDGIEVVREYTDAAGRPPGKIVIGQELTVHLKLRGLGDQRFGTVALVDLLPGGFELVVPAQEAGHPYPSASAGDAAQTDDGDSDMEIEGEDTAADGVYRGWTCGFCTPETTAALQYGEMREDRAVFYVNFTRDVREVSYRIKATNAGDFAVPPAYGEAMYDRSVRGRSTGSRLTVTQP